MSDLRIHTFDSVLLENGAVLRNVDVAYRTWGKLNAQKNNTIVVGHSMSGDSDVAAWWAPLLGPGQALCTQKHFVFCANLLGSCYGTTGPRSINPETGGPYSGDFPLITVRDNVRLQKRLLDEIGVREIAAVIGGSLGGMLALEWGLIDRSLQKIIAVATSGRHSAWCIAWTEAQRQAIYADPNWNGGHYAESDSPEAGLASARMMAMLSYRTPASFSERFGRSMMPGGSRYSVESYLGHQGRKLVERFDANSYVRLSQTSNSHDIARGRGRYVDVLKSISQPTLVIGIDSDVLFPLTEQEELADHIPGAELSVLHSPHGHDAFLLEAETLNSIVNRWLNEPARKTKNLYLAHHHAY